jgi:hypothetical protein
MADSPENKDVETVKTLSNEEIVEQPMATRRTALRVIGTLMVGSVVGAVAMLPSQAEAATDSDPNDAVGRSHRSPQTDSDPNDGVGRRRGSGR